MHELIVYLEPTPGSSLRQCLDYFLTETAPKCYPSTATKYPPHISVTGFFKVDMETEIDSIIAAYNRIHVVTKPTIDLTPFLAHHHLLLPVQVPTDYHTLLNPLQIRPKRMDHLSLAYWDEPLATVAETDAWLDWCHGPGMEKMKQDLREKLLSVVGDTIDWDIVLYERTHHGIHTGERHQFLQLARWSI